MNEELPVTDGQFRNLTPVPQVQEGGDRNKQRLLEVEGELKTYHRILSMFGTQAWKEIEPMLQVELQKGVNLLAKHGVPENVTEFVRGQIAAYQFLMSLPDAVRHNREVARQEMERLQSATEPQ